MKRERVRKQNRDPQQTTREEPSQKSVNTTGFEIDATSRFPALPPREKCPLAGPLLHYTLHVGMKGAQPFIESESGI